MQECIRHPNPLPRSDASNATDKLQILRQSLAAIRFEADARVHLPDQEQKPIGIAIGEGRRQLELAMQLGG